MGPSFWLRTERELLLRSIPRHTARWTGRAMLRESCWCGSCSSARSAQTSTGPICSSHAASPLRYIQRYGWRAARSLLDARLSKLEEAEPNHPEANLAIAWIGEPLRH